VLPSATDKELRIVKLLQALEGRFPKKAAPRPSIKKYFSKT
jgi:hypothetical protein